MKELGNLAIVCAKRDDVQMRIKNQCVSVLVGCTTPKATFFSAWDDDAAIRQIIRELNFGTAAPQNHALG